MSPAIKWSPAAFARVLAGAVAIAAIGCNQGADKQVAASTPASAAPKAPEVRVHAPEPGAPFSVYARGAGELTPDRGHDVLIRVVPDVACVQLVTGVRGIDGVLVKSGAQTRHGRNNAGISASRTISVTAPAGVAGLLAVDVECTKAGGMASTTVAIKAFARGAVYVNKPLGRVVKDPAGGRPVQVMPAEIR